MGLVSGQEYYFTTMVKDGRKYICIDCGSVDNTSLEEAMRIIQANGMKIVESTDRLPEILMLKLSYQKKGS